MRYFDPAGFEAPSDADDGRGFQVGDGSEAPVIEAATAEAPSIVEAA